MSRPDLSFSPRAIWNLTWPQLLMMYIMFFSGIITVWTAGQISSDVQASLGLITQCGIFLMVVIMSVASGATAAISQSMGMRKLLRARLYISSTVFGSIILGLLMAGPAWFFGDQILWLIRTPREIQPICRELWPIFAFSLPMQYVYFASGVIFRATRMVRPPLLVATVVCITNYIGALGFGLGWFGLPAYGYLGLMWTGVVTQTLGAIINCLLLIHSGFFQISLIPSVRWLRNALPYLAKVALPAGAAAIVWQTGYMILFILVGSLPVGSVAALAGLTAGLRAESLLFMPGMAFNMSCSILVGNCLGEGKPDLARRIGLQMTVLGSSIMSVAAIGIWPFRPEIAALLAHDAATQGVIINYLDFNLVATPFSIASTIMGGIMVGAGATKYNLIVYGGTFWAVRLPLGWLLGHWLAIGATGIFGAMAFSQTLQTGLMLYVVLCRNWQRFAMSKKSFKPVSATLQKASS